MIKTIGNNISYKDTTCSVEAELAQIVNPAHGDCAYVIETQKSYMFDGDTMQWTEQKKKESDVTRDEFEDLVDKVDELQLYKFPNATIVGEPTINNGQISGFSQTNYLRFPFLVDFKNKPFVIDVEFMTGVNVTSQENIFDSDFGLAFAIRAGHFVFAVSSNGTSWNIGEGVGTYAVLPNTIYRARLAWDGSNYTFAYSLDGGKNYITDITKASTEQPYPKQIFIGVGQSDVTVLNSFSGIINLNQAYLHIEDKLIWQGMDDVGLATRLSVDLDNIDPDGKAKIKDISEEKLLSQTIKKIHLYDDFEIVSNGTDLPRLHWSDGEVIFGGDYVEIHSVAGEESRARFGDGIIKLEGSPYNAKNATFEMGVDGNNKTYVNINADDVTINGKSQALYEHKITVSGDDVDSDGYWFYFPPFYSTDATELAVNDVEETSPESERKHLQNVLSKLPSVACGIDVDELNWCGVSFYNGVFIASKAVYMGGSYFCGQSKEIWSLSNWRELSSMSVRDVVTKIL